MTTIEDAFYQNSVAYVDRWAYMQLLGADRKTTIEEACKDKHLSFKEWKNNIDRIQEENHSF